MASERGVCASARSRRVVHGPAALGRKAGRAVPRTCELPRKGKTKQGANNGALRFRRIAGALSPSAWDLPRPAPALSTPARLPPPPRLPRLDV